MKKFYLIILVLAGTFAFSQNTGYYNSWRFGLNCGGMWQTSDLTKNSAGFAGGFTLEKGIGENAHRFFSFAIRGRALFGSTYGYSGKRDYNLATNPALNGTYNQAVNYTNDSLSGGQKFIYDNYKTQISEGALELQLSFNRLREQTHVILNLWGGVGFSAFRVNTNLMDGSNKLYDFRKVDSTGSAQNSALSQKSLLDQSYESYARGSKGGNLFTFSPSAGIGLGYQFSKGFSIIWEYKVTFPMGINADLLDGVIGTGNHWLAGSNDFYHYTGVNFLFTLGRGKSKKDTSYVKNYNQASTNTVVPNYNNPHPVIGNPVVNTYPMATGNPPVINIVNPPYSPYVTNSAPFTVHAKVYNITSARELNVNYNGQYISNYSFVGDDLYFQVTLSPGNNTTVISATNRAGSDSKSAIISLQGNPPLVSILNPAANPFMTNNNYVSVNATVFNVSSANDITVSFNGVQANYFSYDGQSGQLSIQLALLEGNNTLEIAGVNQFGRDSKVLTLMYTKPAVVKANIGQSPVSVTITDPSSNPFTTKSTPYPVKAMVSGSTPFTQVSVSVNGNAVNNNFNSSTGDVSFDAPLIPGANNIMVSARKGKSSDSKYTVIVLQQDRVPAPPKVTITNPLASPAVATFPHYVFKAAVQNISSTAQLEVKFNSQVVNNYSFDAPSGLIEFSSNLINGNNLFEVSATNTDGSVKASAVVNYESRKNSDKLKEICFLTSNGYQTITITESEWPAYQVRGATEGPCTASLSMGTGGNEQITICHKGANGNQETIIIYRSEWPSHQAHGDMMGTCPHLGGLGSVDPQIVICHKSPDGSRQTIDIFQSQWSAHQAHGDVMGACPQISLGNAGNQITICHKGNDGSLQTIQIPQSEWPAHQAHGDAMGACPQISLGNAGNQITICHKGNDGSLQTIQIPQSEWPAHQAHGDAMGACPQIGLGTGALQITICHHNADGSKQTMQIPESQWMTHQAHGDTKGQCPTSADQTGNGGPQFRICHKNGDGTMQNMTISPADWPAHRAHGDHMGDCTSQELDPQITICHMPPGNNQQAQTMTISQSAWPAHQAHGDHLGACTPQELDPQITICHIPPGNNQQAQTMTISQSAWPAHQAHGDHLGACSEQESDPQITICHIPPGNNQQAHTINIPQSAWRAHQAHGDHMGPCSPQEADPVITICHFPGNNQPAQTISIPQSAWPAHQAHGDHQGSCSTSEMNPLITICHFPGGNQPAQVITIPQNLWPSHQAHGDHMGNCTSGELVPVSKPPVDNPQQQQINIGPRIIQNGNSNPQTQPQKAPVEMQQKPVTQPQSQPQPQASPQNEIRPFRPR